MASKEFYEKVKAATKDDRRGLIERRNARLAAELEPEQVENFDLGDAIAKHEELPVPITMRAPYEI